MKVCGFTFIRNAEKFDFPIVEAINSVLPICDHFVVTVGNSEDKTRQIIENIAQTAPATKKFSFKEKYEWDQIEKRIPELEKLKSQLEEKLQTVLDQHEALMATSAELAVVIEELNTLELRWLELSEKISG